MASVTSHGRLAISALGLVSTILDAEERADEPLTPVRTSNLGAVPSSHLGGIGIDMVSASLAPHDQSDLGRRDSSRAESSTPDRHINRGKVFRIFIFFE
jgi:hypothetical protein